MEPILLLIGAIISVLVQLVKKGFGTKKWVTISFAVLLSIIVGLYQWLAQQLGFWAPTIEVLGYAGAVYAFIIRQLEE